uniref:Chloride intracellular channel 3 n=1 Tax=Chelydra serpentina TaxID=8475 RepID=A0A8C3SCM5_CHESE
MTLDLSLGGFVEQAFHALLLFLSPQASDDGESIGHCPFCQRLFMILLLKGIPFTLTTVDMRRALDVLKDFAPGAQLPVLLYNGEPKTDTNKIEEFLEETLGPPNFPSLVPRYTESSTAGNDIFHKFSAFIKNSLPAQDEGEGPPLTPLQLSEATAWLSRPAPPLPLALGHSLHSPHLCPQIVCKHYRQLGIPQELCGVWRYLDSAREAKEFNYSCPNSEEIVQAYRTVVRPLK